MKCPKCSHANPPIYIDGPEDDKYVFYACADCGHEYTRDYGRSGPKTYRCAFCGKDFQHVQTEDHTPIAELICPKCAKKMDIEVQTHPDNPENEDNLFSSC